MLKGRWKNLLHWSPRAYATLYLAGIPLFALAYAAFPDGYHYATVREEPGVQARVRTLKLAIQDNLDAALGLTDGSRHIGARFLMQGVRVEAVTVARGGELTAIELDLLLDIAEDSVPTTYVTSRVHVTVYEGSTEMACLDHSPFALNVCDGLPASVGLGHELVPGLLYPSSDFQWADGVLVVPRSVAIALHDLRLELGGIPPTYILRLPRMLYLSVVTITTTGFGDIVPIRPWPRFLVGVQSLIGVVVIGLFLNALARQLSHRD